MTNEEKNTTLYEKVFAEQETYRKWLLDQPPEEILKHSYEYVVREDILLSLEYHDLTNAQAEALLKSPGPLADIFKEFEQRETDYMDTVFDTVICRANAVIKAEARQQPTALPGMDDRKSHSQPPAKDGDRSRTAQKPRQSVRENLQKAAAKQAPGTEKKKKLEREVR